MYGWVKVFADGSKEMGADHDVRMKRASWSRGRLSGMTSVEVHHGDVIATIEGTGEFWQSDDYDVSFMESTPRLLTRRIQKRIEDGDAFLVTNGVQGWHRYVLIPVHRKYEGWSHRRPVPAEWIGKWFTVELDARTQKCLFKIEENRI